MLNKVRGILALREEVEILKKRIRFLEEELEAVQFDIEDMKRKIK